MAGAIPQKELGPAKALIPLMAVVQSNRSKVQPIMDYKELNGFVNMFTANADVCAQKLWEWQHEVSDVAILDLKRVYLKVHVYKLLWPYQTVMLQRQM